MLIGCIFFVKGRTSPLEGNVRFLQEGGISPRCGIEQIRADGIDLLCPFPKRTLHSKEEVRPSTIYIYIYIYILIMDTVLKRE